MKLLILGGTVFLGRHIVESALAHGHAVTLFNRGQHNPDLFPNVEKLHGDRNGNLSALEGRQWDAVIDTSGYIPRVTRASAEALRNSIQHYTFISSISVFAESDKVGITENNPVATLQDETVEEVTNETYGALKALCEQAVEQIMPERTLIVRPGLIVGPDDPTDRFTYWPVRAARGGEMLAPGQNGDQTQFIDVRDLSDWIVRMVEAGVTGIYNATGPDYHLTWGQFLDTCVSVANPETPLVWVGDAFASDLMEREVANFQPWVPAAYASMRSVNCQKAFNAGLTFRPLSDTVRDTLTWKNASPTKNEMRSGLISELEEQLLKEWKEKA